MENKPSGGRFLVALLAFALTAATGIVLLLTTLVVWLSALTGSLVTATLIVSGLCFLLAAAIYALALRAPIDRIQDQVETIYDVAHAAKTGYEWLSGKLQLFLAVREAAQGVNTEKSGCGQASGFSMRPGPERTARISSETPRTRSYSSRRCAASVRISAPDRASRSARRPVSGPASRIRSVPPPSRTNSKSSVGNV